MSPLLTFAREIEDLERNMNRYRIWFALVAILSGAIGSVNAATPPMPMKGTYLVSEYLALPEEFSTGESTCAGLPYPLDQFAPLTTYPYIYSTQAAFSGELWYPGPLKPGSVTIYNVSAGAEFTYLLSIAWPLT